MSHRPVGCMLVKSTMLHPCNLHEKQIEEGVRRLAYQTPDIQTECLPILLGLINESIYSSFVLLVRFSYDTVGIEFFTFWVNNVFLLFLLDHPAVIMWVY
jgi:hypothetical protein